MKHDCQNHNLSHAYLFCRHECNSLLLMCSSSSQPSILPSNFGTLTATHWSVKTKTSAGQVDSYHDVAPHHTDVLARKK
jgi:hypothetical protein